MDKDTEANLIIASIASLCLFSIFLGIALCIHVHGLHWAKAELQKEIHTQYAKPEKDR